MRTTFTPAFILMTHLLLGFTLMNMEFAFEILWGLYFTWIALLFFGGVIALVLIVQLLARIAECLELFTINIMDDEDGGGGEELKKEYLYTASLN